MDDVGRERGLLDVDGRLSLAVTASGVLVSNVGGVYSSSMSKGVILGTLDRPRGGAAVAVFAADDAGSTGLAKGEGAVFEAFR